MTRRPSDRARSPRRRLWSLIALAVMAAALAMAPLAVAETRSTSAVQTYGLAADDHGTIVEFGKDATVAAGETAGVVVAVGGNVYVHGTVQSAVSVGGTVTVDGRVEHTVAAVGGDITLLDSAIVGASNKPSDTAIVLVGGSLHRQPGAAVTGDQTNVRGSWLGNAARLAIWDPISAPYRLHTVVPWIVQTIVFAIVAVLVTATMPRQVRAVTRQLSRRTWASLGWGALATFIILPVSVVILAITIIGLLLVVPGVALGLPLLGIFVGSCVAAVVGGLVLSRGTQHENLILAGLIGALILSLVRFAPFLGAIAMLAAWLFGVGAVVLALAERQRSRRELKRAAREAAAGGYGQPGPYTPAGGPGGPYALPTPPPPPSASYPVQPPEQPTWPAQPAVVPPAEAAPAPADEPTTAAAQPAAEAATMRSPAEASEPAEPSVSQVPSTAEPAGRRGRAQDEQRHRP